MASKKKTAVPKVIFGAGKQAGHVLYLLEWIGLPWKNVLLFDDAFPGQKKGARDVRIAGRLEDGFKYCRSHRVPAMVALGTHYAALRYSLFTRLQKAGVSLANVIHPSCVIAPTAKLGQNILMMPGCVVSPGVELGSMCSLFANTTLEHDTVVKDNVFFGPGSVTAASVKIGKHAFIGAGAVCAPEVQIGERSLIGAGAVVASNIPAGVVAVGVPARDLKPVTAGSDAPTESELRQLGL